MNETPLAPVASPSVATEDRRTRDIRVALTSAAKLGSSLLVTWGIAFVARLYVPRFLGPDRFGTLNFADAFTAAAFVLMGLGLDTYVRREIAVRPEHANDFVGGIVALRLMLLVFVFGGMEVVLRATHRGAEVRHLVYIYGAAQFFMVGGATSAGMLHATSRVNEMSVLSVVVKFGWAACIAIAILFHLDLWAFALTVAVTEGIKSFILFWLARKHLRFEVRIHPRATWAVIVAALPFYVSGLATTFYDKIGVSLLAFLTSDREVGWYGAAAGLAGLTLLLVPLVAWVLIPLLARSAAESEDELYRMVRRSLEFILTLAIPVSLMMALGADVWISVLFGRAFAPSVAALRVLAIANLLMYLSIVAVYALAVLKLTWRMSLVFVGGMVINPVCNMLLIRPMSTLEGPGGGGTACAIATLVTEIAVVTPLLIMLGRRAFDRRLLGIAGKSLAAALFVTALDILTLRRLGPVRLLVDGVVYVALVLVTGGIEIRGTAAWLRAASRVSRAHGAEPTVPTPQ